MDVVDIPSDHSFFDPGYVRHWLEDTTVRNPARPAFFDAFAEQLSAPSWPALSVLELGSGPGVLAEHILARCQVAKYWLADVSPSMHDLARERVGNDPRTVFVVADFRDAAWVDQLAEPVDAVVSMQALHELRHSSRAPMLYRQLAGVARPGALVLICDHLRSADDDRRLFMTVAEHLGAMSEGGLQHPTMVMLAGRLALFRAHIQALQGVSGGQPGRI